MNIDWQELGDKAIEAALAAGKVINSYREKDLEVETKEGASSYAAQVVTEVDRAAEKVILDILEPTCKTYDLAMLSEESVDDGSRFEKDFFWCIDPMKLMVDKERLEFVQKEFEIVKQWGITGFPTVVYQEKDKAYLLARGYQSLEGLEENLKAVREAV